MKKEDLRQILARNLRAAMARDSTISTQEKLAAKSKLSQSHISRLLLCEAAATTDALMALAVAVRCEPWELLTDAQATRKAALEKLLSVTPVSDERVAEHLPPTPRRRKAGG
jgi:transcriptional regulator with XRE-family HTH domain